MFAMRCADQVWNLDYLGAEVICMKSISMHTCSGANVWKTGAISWSIQAWNLKFWGLLLHGGLECFFVLDSWWWDQWYLSLTFNFLNLFLKINRCLIYFGAWFVMTSGSFGNDLNSFNKLKDKCWHQNLSRWGTYSYIYYKNIRIYLGHNISTTGVQFQKLPFRSIY